MVDRGGGVTAEAQQRASQAISGIATALTDITQELHNVQQQLQYWRVEADAWKARYEQERARTERLRRVLRCTPVNHPNSSGLTARPSLTSTPRGALAALKATSSAQYNLSSAGGGVSVAAAAGAAGGAGRELATDSSIQQQQQHPAGWTQPGSSSSSGPRGSNSSSSSSSLSPTREQQHQQQLQAQQQRLRPLKCVPEGRSNSSSSSSSSGGSAELATQQQQQQQQQDGPDSTSSSQAHDADTAATCTTTVTTAAAAAARQQQEPAGSDSPSADPFAHYAGPVASDPGECSFRFSRHSLQQEHMPQGGGGGLTENDSYCDSYIRNEANSGSSSPVRFRDQQRARRQLEVALRDGSSSSNNNSTTALLEAAAAAAAAGGGAAGGAGGFRRARTMPLQSSFSAVQSPSFSAGFYPGAFLNHAASLLPSTYSGGAGDKAQNRHTVDQLLRVMMAFTLMQGAAGDDADDQQGVEPADEDVLPSVSLDDDDGSSGVGLAAAAAVSAAMARAWASAASREQRAVAAAAASGAGGAGGQGRGRGGGGKEAGGSSSGRAGFRLVATVTNKMGKRQASGAALSSYASQDSMDTHATNSTADLPSLLQQQGQQQGGAASKPPLSGSSSPAVAPLLQGAGGGGIGGSSAAGAAGILGGGGSASPARPSTATGSGAGAGVGGAPGAGASPTPQRPSTAVAAAAGGTSAAPNSGQATTISLQWLSRPRTVLVMRKLAPSTEAAFLRALDWLRRHQVTIFVEPKVFQELVDAGRVVPLTQNNSATTTTNTQQQQQQQTVKPPDGSNSSGAAAAAAAAASVPHTSSSGSLAGMLISTKQTPPSATALFPMNSWAGPGSGSGGSGSNAAAAAGSSGSGGGGTAATAAGAVVGAGGAAAGVIKTWQPELHIDQQQQQQQADGGSSSSSMVVASDLIPESVAQQLDLVVVLGGDGTVLWTCHIFGNRSVPPLVPFNLGSLGFLTPFDPARLEQVLLKTFRGGFPITLRHRLHCTIVRCSTAACSSLTTPAQQQQQQLTAAADDGATMPSVSNSCVGTCVYGEEHVSLNEVVIERGISPFLTNLECFCDGAFVTHVQGDGLIVGTPTGSTAYSLAAGGSMVHPQVPCILFTPICPHSLSFRPLMFPDYVQLCVQVPADARGHVWASFDGKDRTELGPGDAVVIRLSKWPVPSVAAEADPSSDWFSAVRECLHWNLRKVQGGVGM